MGRVGKIFVALSLPFILLMVFINLLMSTTFLQIEYRTPWFPDDQYGFTNEDRLNYGATVIQYITSDDDRFLLDHLEDNNGNQIFLKREVDHLVDVKNVLIQMNQIHLFILTIAAFFISISLFKRTDEWKTSIRTGAFFALFLLLAIGLFALTSFWSFFEKFHAIFFDGDSWLFNYSDAILRLFPLRLWQDAVLYLVTAIIIASLGLLFWIKPKP